MHFILSVIIFIGELFIKNDRECNKEKHDYFGGNVRITTSHNYGAFLNAGDKKPIIVKTISVALSFVLTIVFISTFTKRGRKELRTALALLLGGAYSNTYDRVRRGYVVDYLQFPKLPKNMKHVVYNISDFCILIGALFLCMKSGECEVSVES